MLAGADACRLGKTKGWAMVEVGPVPPGEVRFEEDLRAYFDSRTPERRGSSAARRHPAYRRVPHAEPTRPRSPPDR